MPKIVYTFIAQIFVTLYNIMYNLHKQLVYFVFFLFSSFFCIIYLPIINLYLNVFK